MRIIDKNEIENCFDSSIHLINLNVVWERLGI